jgi:hypothetical protein
MNCCLRTHSGFILYSGEKYSVQEEQLQKLDHYVTPVYTTASAFALCHGDPRPAIHPLQEPLVPLEKQPADSPQDASSRGMLIWPCPVMHIPTPGGVETRQRGRRKCRQIAQVIELSCRKHACPLGCCHSFLHGKAQHL